jgi:pimeloyl-ACP methyl ester carboxylesterase
VRRLILLHGVGSSAKAWEPLRPFLEEYELVALDLPGFGSAPPLPHRVEASIPAHADVVERELDARGIEAADLVGTRAAVGSRSSSPDADARAQ